MWIPQPVISCSSHQYCAHCPAFACAPRLYYLFKPEYTYWILIILTRKLLLAVCELMFRTNVTFQLSTVLLDFFWAYVLQTRNNPYMSTFEFGKVVKDNKKKLETLVEVNMERSAMESRLKKRGSITQIRNAAIDRFRQRSRALGDQYLWNWNNVEGTLLMCAVLVNVFGIMFASEYVEVGSETYNALGSLTLSVIIFSLIYYFMVVWSEIFIKFAPGLLGTCDRIFCFICKKNENATRRESVSVELGDLHAGVRTSRSSVTFENVRANPLVQQQGESSQRFNTDALMSFEKQVELSKTVEKLMAQNQELKKALAAAELASQQSAKPFRKKVKKRNIGGEPRTEDFQESLEVHNGEANDAAGEDEGGL